MGRQIVIRSSHMASTRRQLLLSGTLRPSATPTPTRVLRKPTLSVGEVAGGTAAECCVICCCCPCVVLEFLILVVYKVPSTLCRLIVKKRRQRRLKKKRNKGVLTGHGPGPGPSPVASGPHLRGYYDPISDVDLREVEKIMVTIDGSPEAMELDTKMWEQFHNAGFWRSHSRRHS